MLGKPSLKKTIFLLTFVNKDFTPPFIKVKNKAPKVTHSDPKVTHSDPTHLPFPPPASPGSLFAISQV